MFWRAAIREITESAGPLGPWLPLPEDIQLSDVEKSPPFSKDARPETGFSLRKLQKSQKLEIGIVM
jgi:hypothetical protein